MASKKTAAGKSVGTAPVETVQKTVSNDSITRVVAGINMIYKGGKKKCKFPLEWNVEGGEVAGANAKIVATGDGVVVIDIDTKDLSVVDPKLIALLKPFKPSQETARGFHYGFMVDASTKFTNRSKITEYVDIRSDGGGIFYEYTGSDKRISYTGLDPQNLNFPKMPKKLHKLLLSMRKPSPDLDQAEDLEPTGIPTAEVKKMLKCIKTQDDSYDAWLEVGMILHTWGHADKCQKKALKLWDKWSQKSTSYDADEVEDKWRSFEKSYPGKKRTISSLIFSAQDGGYSLPSDYRKPRSLGGKKILPDDDDSVSDEVKTKLYRDLKSKAITTITLAGVPYPTKGLTMLTGDGGVGKSFIALQVAISYLEQHPKEKALFWFTEDHEAIVKERVGSVTKNKDILSRMVFVTADINNLKDSVKTAVELSQKFGIIILDPLISFFTGEENSNSEARSFGNRLKKMHGLVILIHHSAKSGSASRGASDFRNMVRMVYKVVKPQVRYKKSGYERRADDLQLLGYRAMMVDKDNWGVTVKTRVTAYTDEDSGFLIKAFDVDKRYRENVITQVTDIRAELRGYGQSDTRIAEEHTVRKSSLGGASMSGKVLAA